MIHNFHELDCYELISRIRGHSLRGQKCIQNDVASVCILPRCSWIDTPQCVAVGGAILLVMEMETAKPLLRFQHLDTYFSFSVVTASAVQGDVVIAAAGSGAQILFFSMRHQTLFYCLEAHESGITGLAFSPSHPNILASTSLDGTTKIWHLDETNTARSENLCSPLRCVAVLIAGKDSKKKKEIQTMIKTRQRNQKSINVETVEETPRKRQKVQKKGGHMVFDSLGMAGTACAWREDGKALLTGHDTGVIVPWELESAVADGIVASLQFIVAKKKANVFNCPVDTVAFLNEELVLGASSPERSVRVFSVSRFFMSKKETQQLFPGFPRKCFEDIFQNWSYFFDGQLQNRNDVRYKTPKELLGCLRRGFVATVPVRSGSDDKKTLFLCPDHTGEIEVFDLSSVASLRPENTKPPSPEEITTPKAKKKETSYEANSHPLLRHCVQLASVDSAETNMSYPHVVKSSDVLAVAGRSVCVSTDGNYMVSSTNENLFYLWRRKKNATFTFTPYT